MPDKNFQYFYLNMDLLFYGWRLPYGQHPFLNRAVPIERRYHRKLLLLTAASVIL